MKLFPDKFNSNPIRIPAEWEPHSSCWMAWAVHPEWLGWVDEVKSELAEVISTIAKYETVRLLTPPHELAEAKARFGGGNVEIIEAPVNDIWMSDIALCQSDAKGYLLPDCYSGCAIGISGCLTEGLLLWRSHLP